jgi:uncharacterized protein (DUF2062 family)/SAM-dependent methyltransferase
MKRTVRRFFYRMRSEGSGAVRESVAIGLGAFVGCLPIFGLHLGACIVLGWLLGLNRLKMYLAANISNPFVAPLLLFSEVQLGSLVRRGVIHSITIDTVRTASLRTLGGDLVIGSIMLGTLLGIVLATVTYLSLRASDTDPAFFDLVRQASDRYLGVSITAWEFARGKLRGDPLYRSIVCSGLLPDGQTLLDVGCGSGLMLALLAEARSRVRSGAWDSGLPRPPLFERMVGIDIRPRVVDVARQALGADAEIFEGDARQLTSSTHDAVLICDVLHMMSFDEQEQVIAVTRRSLRDGGVLVVREADAAGGWRFFVVRAGNRLKSIVLRNWRQRFYFRTQLEWCALFARHGLAVTEMANGGRTPFASVLFRLTAVQAASATSRTHTLAG